MRVYTLGYQGLSIGEYLRSLRDSQVGAVLDVRENAWSYRPEYVKSTLASALTVVGIDYVHLPSAGNPKENRKSATSAEECLGRYRQHLLHHPDCIEELYSLIRSYDEAGRPACLTCYEGDPSQCHRSILIEALIEFEPRINPIHLPLLSQPTKRTFSLQKTSFIHPGWLPST